MSNLPPWVKEVAYVGGFIISLTIFGQQLKSDQRSTREEMGRLSADVAATRNDVNAIRANLPNAEMLDYKFKDLEGKLAAIKEELGFEAAKAQKFREDLLKKGLVD